MATEKHAFQFDATEALGEWREVERSLTDKTPILKILGNLMLRSIGRTFREEGSPAGSWRRVFASTLRQAFESKPAKNPRKTLTKSGKQTAGFTRFVKNQRLLYGSGTLARSISFEVRPGENATIIGSNLKYARIHQFGGVIVPKNRKFLRFPVGGGQFVFTKRVVIPARPFLVLRPEDPEAMAEGVRDYLIAKFAPGTRNPAPGT